RTLRLSRAARGSRGESGRRVQKTYGRAPRPQLIGYINFRLCQAQSSSQRRISCAAATHQSVIRVLYVEDDHRLAHLTSVYLETQGLEVHVVPHAEPAIGEVRADVVVIELANGHGGAELCDRVRAHHVAPIIVIGRAVDGADDHLPKPFTARELLARIHAQV